MNKRPSQIPAYKQYKLPQQAFDAFNKDTPIQDALGSKRTKQRQEASDIRSTNWKPGVSGWRLTPNGIEFGDPSLLFIVGLALQFNSGTLNLKFQDTASVDLSEDASGLKATTIGATGTFTTTDWTVTVVNGLITSIVTTHSASPSLSPSLSPSVSPS